MSVLLAVAVFCGVLTSGWLTTEVEANTQAIADGVYFIRNMHSNLVMHVPNGEPAGTPVHQWGYFVADHLQWRITRLSNGNYRITTFYNANLHLTPSGSRVIVDITPREWVIVANGTGFSIRPANVTSSWLANTSQNNDNPASMVSSSANNNARWLFESACSKGIGSHLWEWRTTTTATCILPGQEREHCRRQGCTTTGATRTTGTNSNAHNTINRVCRNHITMLGGLVLATCGRIENPVSGGFTHYMYRGESQYARNIPSGSNYKTNHWGIDLTNGSGTTIEGFPIYAQGNGTVVARSDEDPHPIMGHYIIIRYGGDTVRYLHLHSRPTLAPGTSSNPTTVDSSRRIGITGNTGLSSEPHLHYDVNDFGSHGPNTSRFKNPNHLFPQGTFVNQQP